MVSTTCAIHAHKQTQTNRIRLSGCQGAEFLCFVFCERAIPSALAFKRFVVWQVFCLFAHHRITSCISRCREAAAWQHTKAASQPYAYISTSYVILPAGYVLQVRAFWINTQCRSVHCMDDYITTELCDQKWTSRHFLVSVSVNWTDTLAEREIS